MVKLAIGIDTGRGRTRVARGALLLTGLSPQCEALAGIRSCLLDDVRELVSDQSPSFGRIRRVLSLAEYHLWADGVSQRAHGAR